MPSIGNFVGLSVVALSLTIAYAGDFDADQVRLACPGIASWQQSHPDPTKASPRQAGTNPNLAAKLHKMAAEDQDVRHFDPLHLSKEVFERLEKVDHKNDKALRTIIRRHEVPTVALIGTDGMADYWLLVQHADHDIHLQESVLKQFEDGKSGASLSEVAYLTDRVRGNQWHPQMYGTQFESTDGGPLMPKEIEDIAHLDERRQKMGLMPFADYQCGIKALYPDPAAPSNSDLKNSR
jgi:hypothetical protein